MNFESNEFLGEIDPDVHYFDPLDYELSSSDTSNYFSVADFTEFMDSSPGFTCLNYNIRSFNKNFDNFFCIFGKFKNLPDVLVLTETWFELDSLKYIPGYRGYHEVREGVRSGGVSVYVAEHISASVLPQFTYVDSMIEVCTVQLSLNNSITNIVGIYRPHGDTIVNFINSLESILNGALNDNSTILLGDLNINLLSEDNSTSNLVNLMQSYHFLPLTLTPLGSHPITIRAQHC